jgi:hypothetical protein
VPAGAGAGRRGPDRGAGLVLAGFTAGQGYADDADYSARSWLIHHTHITPGAAVGHTAWAKRTGTHPRVLAALAAGQVSESVGRLICLWTGKPIEAIVVLLDRTPGQPGKESTAASDLTPVMARLGPTELEIVDTLISAGIAPNRAEAIRWSLARISERPAYAQLRERTREIERLKSEF